MPTVHDGSIATDFPGRNAITSLLLSALVYGGDRQRSSGYWARTAASGLFPKNRISPTVSQDGGKSWDMSAMTPICTQSPSFYFFTAELKIKYSVFNPSDEIHSSPPHHSYFRILHLTARQDAIWSSQLSRKSRLPLVTCHHNSAILVQCITHRAEPEFQPLA